MNFDEITAPSTWRCVDFISDIHLQESEPANFLAWCQYLERTSADAIFILGDLFEVWVGDDVLTPFAQTSIAIQSETLGFEDRCIRALRLCSERVALFYLHGNRDFLIGQDFAAASGMRLLADPSVLAFGGLRYLLSHGDALCLADVEYQSFRAQVRSAKWQQEFLALPLHERLKQARQMRDHSEQRKRAQGGAMHDFRVDVDGAAAAQWLDATNSQHFIHGHTHEGKDHDVGRAAGLSKRHVLPDWHLAGYPARGHVLRLTRQDGASADVDAVRVERVTLPRC